MTNGELASDGLFVYPQHCAVSYTYSANGNLLTETIQQYGATYVRTSTYSVSGQLTNVSIWVKQ